MSKRIGLVVCVLALLAGSLTACQKLGTDDVKNGMVMDGTEIVSLENPNMTMLYWSPEVDENTKKAITEYESKYGGKVDVQVSPSFDEYTSKIVALYASGQSPDWVGLYDWQAMGLLSKDVLEDVSKYVGADDADFYLPAMKNIQYKSQYYGMCGRPDPILVYYNKRLFKNAGQKTPLEYWEEGSWTWDTLKALGQELTIRENGQVTQWGFGGSSSDTVLRSNDGMYTRFNDAGGIDITIREERTTKAFKYMQDMYIGNDAWTKFVASNSDQEFVDGTLAMAGGRQWNAEMNYYNKMSDEFGIVPFPAGPDVSADCAAGGSNWYVCAVKGAKNPAGTVAFYKLTQKQNQVQERHAVWNEEHKRVFEKMNTMTIYSGFPSAVGINSELIWTPICQQGKPVSQVVESVVPALQSAIDKFMSESEKVVVQATDSDSTQ